MTENAGPGQPAQPPGSQMARSVTTSADASAGPPEFAPTSSGDKLVWVIGIVVLIVAVALLIALFGTLRHWFALHTGTLHGGPDLYYNFWSGFGSDLGEATLISAVSVGVYTGVRKVNCHTKGCWRIGHHPLDGTPYILCKHHHPAVPNGGATHEQILAQHHSYKLQQEAERRARAAS